MLLKKALIAVFVVGAVGFPTAPSPPSEDPFYTPPVGFETKYKVGDIISHRPVPGTLAAILVPEKVQNAWQLLVRSEDSLGNPNAIVTTLIQPFNANPEKLLSYQIAEDTIYINCAPSYQLQVGAPIDTTAGPENAFIVAALDQGWYVNTPDYEGPKSVYPAGLQEGKATLNSIRAVLSSGSFTGISSKPTTALWGYSGGTIATGWAANLAPTYAPELKFVGAAMGGVVPNLTATIQYLSGALFAGFGIAGIVGLTREYPDINTVVSSNLKMGSQSVFDSVEKVCLGEILIEHAFANFWDLVEPGEQILYDPRLSSILKTTNLIQDDHLPNIPFFFYHAIGDEVAPIAPVEVLYDNWCSRGLSVNFQVDMTGEHITEAVFGSGKAFVWILDRMNGKPAQRGCTKSTNLSNAFDLRGIIALGGVVVDALLAILGKAIGDGYGFDIMALVG